MPEFLHWLAQSVIMQYWPDLNLQVLY